MLRSLLNQKRVIFSIFSIGFGSGFLTRHIIAKRENFSLSEIEISPFKVEFDEQSNTNLDMTTAEDKEFKLNSTHDMYYKDGIGVKRPRIKKP
jgi:hypothetical protein